MPGIKQHAKKGFVLGAFVGALKALADADTNGFGEILKGASIGAIGGAMGGLAPDIIEPANNPNHRRLAHSKAVGVGGLTSAFEKIGSSSRLTPPKKIFLFSALLGYAAHLIDDNETPKGLPLI